MPQFIETKAGRISLNYVVSVNEVWRQKDKVVTITYMEGDSVKTTTCDRESDYVMNCLSELIPAQPGAFVWRYFTETYEHTGENRGRPLSVGMERDPVIAWLLDSRETGGLTPINGEGNILGPPDNYYYLIPMDGDRVAMQYVATYGNLDEAKADILRDRQRDWDHEKEYAAKAREAAA